MPEGRVKWFDAAKGYGFIEQTGKPDVFVHHTAINWRGFRTLYEGEPVSYEVIETAKGEQAVNVLPLERRESSSSSPPGGPEGFVPRPAAGHRRPGPSEPR